MTFYYKSDGIEYEVVGEYSPGFPETRSWECPMGYPGDPDEFNIVSIVEVGDKFRIDRFKDFSESELDRIVDIGLDLGRNG